MAYNLYTKLEGSCSVVLPWGEDTVSFDTTSSCKGVL